MAADSCVFFVVFRKGKIEHKHPTSFPPFSGVYYKHMLYSARNLYAVTSKKIPIFCCYKSMGIVVVVQCGRAKFAQTLEHDLENLQTIFLKYF